MRLWVVRHAATHLAADVCCGRTDAPAQAELTQQAAVTLAPLLPRGASMSVSPRRRCRQLADAIAALRPDLSPMEDARLAEFDFGDWEGRTWDEIGAAALAAWTSDFAHHRPGGGESVSAFMARVGAALQDLPVQGDAIWIAHAGVARAASLHAQGLHDVRDAAQWPVDAPPTGGWRVIELQPRGNQR